MQFTSDDKTLKDGSKNARLEWGRKLELRKPELADGAEIFTLVESCEPLDKNSVYSYLLLCHHFADTCVVAEEGEKIVAFLSGYRPPGREEVFFVWQVAVDPRMRGRGLGKLLLQEVLRRPASRGCRFLETTISPSNEASQRLFCSLARDLKARSTVTSCFSEDHFGHENHEAEPLFRIGPFLLEQVI
ncbi:MAG TPA: diaminobutyrate acetyltransferase [Methanotrichaceae archaeon]|nr:diaminobutyrate acetyltransferase [Methanotrichaceae archaeon]